MSSMRGFDRALMSPAVMERALHAGDHRTVNRWYDEMKATGYSRASLCTLFRRLFRVAPHQLDKIRERAQ